MRRLLDCARSSTSPGVSGGASISAKGARAAAPAARASAKVATGFQVIAAHDRRHLWQAEQVEREIRQRAAP